MASKQFSSPSELWNLFLEYEKATKSNPRLKHIFVGKDGHPDYEEKEIPISLDGFELFSMEHGYNESADLSEYFECKNESYKDFFPLCRAIKKKIRKDQIEGGMAGIYNPSITQRLNGLVEKSEVKANIDGQIFKGINLDVSGDDSPKEDSKTS